MAAKVGLNPKDFKNVKALCAGIMTKVELRAHKTLAKINRERIKSWKMPKEYNKQQNNKLKRIEEMRKRVREMEMKKINRQAYPSRVGGGRIVKRSPGANRSALELFKIVGLKK